MTIVTALFMVLFFFFADQCRAITQVNADEQLYQSTFEKKVYENLPESPSADELLALYLSSNPGMDEELFQDALDEFHFLTDQFDKSALSQNINEGRRAKVKRELKKIKRTASQGTELISEYLGSDSNKNLAEAFYYSALFTRMEIPIAVQLNKVITGILLYPDSKRVLIPFESTGQEKAPTAAPDFQAAYVEYLSRIEVLGQLDYEFYSVEELFYQNFYSKELLFTVHLQAYSQFVQAFDKLNEKAFEEALIHAEKACWPKPTNKASFVRLYALSEIVESLSTRDARYTDFLIRLFSYNNKGLSEEDAAGLFLQYTTDLLVDKKNIDEYDRSFKKILSSVSDKRLRDEIAGTYYTERGKRLYNEDNYREAEGFINEAFALLPYDTEVKQLFFSIMLLRMQEIKKGEDAYSLEKFEQYFQTITEYKTNYSHLNEMQGFRLAYLYFCLGIMDQCYRFDEGEKAEKYRTIFESDYPIPNTGFKGINKGIASAYSSAIAYYNNKQNKSMSLAIANKGLYYVPGNTVLEDLKKQIQF